MNQLFASFYEGWGLFWLGDFSNDMYTNNLYLPIGLVLIISSIVWMAVYYYGIDHPKFAKGRHWLLWILILCAINYTFARYYSFSQLDMIYAAQGKEIPFHAEFTNFSFVNALWAFIFAFLVSLLIKGKSVMCKRTPF